MDEWRVYALIQLAMDCSWNGMDQMYHHHLCTMSKVTLITDFGSLRYSWLLFTPYLVSESMTTTAELIVWLIEPDGYRCLLV